MPIGTMHARCNCGATVGVCNCLCHEARHGNSFTPEEAKRGYAMRGGTKVYCCYGMYADVGHSDDCKVAASSTAGVLGGPIGVPVDGNAGVQATRPHNKPLCADCTTEHACKNRLDVPRPCTRGVQPARGLGWIVRERRSPSGELLDCFVEAPQVEGMAYGCEVLGDDYTGYGGIEGKLKHCQMIVAWANAAGVPETQNVSQKGGR